MFNEDYGDKPNSWVEAALSPLIPEENKEMNHEAEIDTRTMSYSPQVR
jgi:hypothetical protein